MPAWYDILDMNIDRKIDASQLRQSAVSGGINAYTTYRGAVDDEQNTKGIFVLSSKALNRNFKLMSELLFKTLTTVCCK